MSYIEMVVPLDISTSELLVAIPTLPAEERPVSYVVGGNGTQFFDTQNKTGEMTLHINDKPRNAKEKGTSEIKIHGSRPLKPQNKIFPMLIFRLFK
jgi:hypothetical protein